MEAIWLLNKFLNGIIDLKNKRQSLINMMKNENTL